MTARAGIVAALRLEAQILARAWRTHPPQARAVCSVAGIGRASAMRAATDLLAAGCTSLACWGFAGALDPRLASGALLLPTTVVGQRRAEHNTDPAWQGRMQAILAPHLTTESRPILEVTHPVVDAASKATLFAQTGAIALDMESGAVAEIARSADVPFVVLKAVVDTAHDELPRAALRAIGAGGKLSTGVFDVRLLSRPAELRQLLRLWRGVRTARRTLSRAAYLLGPGLQAANGRLATL